MSKPGVDKKEEESIRPGVLLTGPELGKRKSLARPPLLNTKY